MTQTFTVTQAMQEAHQVKIAIARLREARGALVAANCPRAADKVRRALKSAEGALRNVSVRQWRAGAVFPRDFE